MARRTQIHEIEEQAALYALDALAPEEAGSFQDRLAAGCSLCRTVFEECRGTVALLPLAAPEVEPRPEVRDRLLERIGVTAAAGVGMGAHRADLGVAVEVHALAGDRGNSHPERGRGDCLVAGRCRAALLTSAVGTG